MIEQLADRVNADARLVNRGRYLTTTFLLEVGDDGYLIQVAEGRIANVKPGPFVSPSWSFALRAPREAWEKFWQPVPPPGYNDLIALSKYRRLRIEGDVRIFMTHLRYFKDMMATLRPGKATA